MEDKLLDYIKGTLSEEEKSEIKYLISNDNTFKKEYDKLVENHLLLQFSSKEQKIDLVNAKSKINKIININKNYFLVLKLSAVFIIGVFITLIYFVDEKSNKKIVAQTKINPGKKTATLILSNGKQISLNNKIKYVEKDGSLINISNNKQTTYTSIKQKKKKELIYNTLKIPVGGEWYTKLSDGTEVWLNSKSSLKYPVDFIGSKREVYVQGEAIFKVTPNQNKPFIVNVKNSKIRVLGTEFLVSDFNGQTKTLLLEGSIRFKKARNKALVLKPNHLLVADKKRIVIKKVSNTDQYVSWREGMFVFVNENLESIMDKLQRWYGFKTFYLNESVKRKRYTASIKRYSDISKILYLFERTSDVKFEVHKNSIIIKKK